MKGIFRPIAFREGIVRRDGILLLWPRRAFATAAMLDKPKRDAVDGEVIGLPSSGRQHIEHRDLSDHRSRSGTGWKICASSSSNVMAAKANGLAPIPPIADVIPVRVATHPRFP